MQWDGSFIGEFDTNIIIKNILDMQGDNYFFLNFGKIVICRYTKTFKNCYFECIVDEIKPIFNINKTGTHSIKIGKLYYIIFKTKIKKSNDGFKINWETPLFFLDKNSELFKNDQFIHTVRMMIAFKEIIGMRRDIMKKICVKNEKKMILITKNESNYNSCLSESLIPIKIFENWFPEKDLSDYVKLMCNAIDKITDDGIEYKESFEILFSIRNKVSNVINRIDNKYIQFCDFIINNCNKYLD